MDIQVQVQVDVIINTILKNIFNGKYVIILFSIHNINYNNSEILVV